MTKFKKYVKKIGATKAAKRLGLSRIMIYKICSGDRKPSLTAARRISRITNIPIKTLRPDLARYFK